MKILLVDDQYRLFSLLIQEIGQLIETEAALTAVIALQIINNHPESDAILLDGYFKDGTCMEVVPYLNEEQRRKIICFSGKAEDWKIVLSNYGIKHFPGKQGDYAACINGQCSC